MHSTSCEDRSAGGLLVLVRRDVVADATEHSFEELCAGRAAVLRVRWPGGGALCCVCVHNFAISVDAMWRVAAALQSAREASDAEPGRVCAFAMGDWNLQALGEGYASQAEPGGPQRLPTAGRAGQRRLGTILRRALPE